MKYNKNYNRLISELKLEQHILKKDTILNFIRGSDIPDRVKSVGIDYYILNDNPTLKYVGDIYKVSPERIRQITAKFLRMLAHPSRYQYLLARLDEKYSCLIVKRDELRQCLNAINMEIREYHNDVSEHYETDITEFHFSVRIQNAFESAGIKSIYDLTNYTERELVCMKNIGPKSLHEIKCILAGVNLKLI